MELIKIILDVTYSILTIKISLLGYSISLWNVVVFTGLLFVIMYLVFKMLD